MTIIFSSGIRTASYRRHWPTLVRAYGQTCYYCQEFATTIDHIVPVAAGGSNDIMNLVLACSWCNLLAGDKVFETLDDKQEYILRRRARRGKVTRCTCSDCLMPFEYRTLSPSLFLCAECYDENEGSTMYSTRSVWYQWLETLDAAGVPLDAHRRVRTLRVKSRRAKLTALVQIAYYGYTE